MKVIVNGELLNETDASVSISDRGFLLGEGLFETMRAYNGVIFMLERHLDRLIEGANVLGFESIPERRVLAETCKEVLIANELDDARLRLTLTAGSEKAGRPTMVITAKPYTGYDRALYNEGMTALTLKGFRIAGSPVHALKATSYLSSAMSKKIARDSGCNEAILINEQNNVAEGSVSNIFALKEGVIYTPPLSDGLLPGVTREAVIGIVVKAGYMMLQQSVKADDILSMDEIFLTNSLMEIMPLTKMDGRTIGTGHPGLVTLEIIDLYKQRISLMCGP